MYRCILIFCTPLSLRRGSLKQLRFCICLNSDLKVHLRMVCASWENAVIGIMGAHSKKGNAAADRSHGTDGAARGGASFLKRNSEISSSSTRDASHVSSALNITVSQKTGVHPPPAPVLRKAARHGEMAVLVMESKDGDVKDYAQENGAEIVAMRNITALSGEHVDQFDETSEPSDPECEPSSDGRRSHRGRRGRGAKNKHHAPEAVVCKRYGTLHRKKDELPLGLSNSEDWRAHSGSISANPVPAAESQGPCKIQPSMTSCFGQFSPEPSFAGNWQCHRETCAKVYGAGNASHWGPCIPVPSETDAYQLPDKNWEAAKDMYSYSRSHDQRDAGADTDVFMNCFAARNFSSVDREDDDGDDGPGRSCKKDCSSDEPGFLPPEAYWHPEFFSSSSPHSCDSALFKGFLGALLLSSGFYDENNVF